MPKSIKTLIIIILSEWIIAFNGAVQDKLCLPHHILEEKGLIKVGITVQALLDETSANETLIT